jgi:oligosaccharide 4-alpha-D-glucosyltransferase
LGLLASKIQGYRLASLIICCFSTINTVHAKQSTEHYVSHQVINGNVNKSLIINTAHTQVTLSAYGDAIEVLYKKTDADTSMVALPSYAIKENAQKLSFTLEEKNKQLIFTSNTLTAVINKSPFSISYYQDNKLLISEESGYFTEVNLPVTVSTTKVEKKVPSSPINHGFRFKLAKQEKLLGTGERVLGMNRRGHRLPLYNKAHYGYTTESTQMNFGIPAVMSTNKYILLFDNSAKGWIDLGKTEKDILQFEAVNGRSSYIVIAGSSYPQLINNYVNLTGKQPLPPRWALGSFASRFGYRNEQEVRDTVNKFIDLDIPLDALVLDLYWFGKDIQGHMGNLEWDKEAFPKPERMMRDIKAQGVKTVLITEPFILTNSGKWQEAVDNNALAKTLDGKAKRFDFYFGNTGIVDIFNQQGRDWFKSIYKKLAEQGVSGWWGDLGEPEVHPSDTLHTLDNGDVVNADAIHNVYGHQWAKMLFEQQDELDPQQRPFILMRSGFAGSQRYGMIPWTGDVSRSWDGLKPQVELSLQMSLLGLAYTHSDLGGFAGGEKFDKEMYIRWLQYGVFQPIYRPHAQDNIAAEVVFHDKETQDILRDFIKLRYQLLPYNYTLAYQNSITGMPLMRPLFFEDESNLNLIDNATSYLWGDAFLVTPVVEAGVKSVSVNLPQGVWFHYFTGEKHLGGVTVELSTSIETLPVLVRAGSFVPMIESVQTTENYDSRSLTLHYYADSSVTNSSGKMFEDDGKSSNSIEKNTFELLTFSAKQNTKDKSLAISLTHSGHYANMPKQRDVKLVVHHLETKPKQITLADKVIAVSQKEDSNAYWNTKDKSLTFKLNWQHQALTLIIK